MRQLLTTLASAVLAVSLSWSASAASFKPTEKAEIESIIQSYLLEHPEILRDMSIRLDAADKEREVQARAGTLKNKAAEIFHDETDAVLGNPKGDVTVVEFMDYNCGWCKKSVKEMKVLLETDKNIRVVMKEFPIFGEGSEYAAKAALASVKQGKYWELHQALFAAESKVTPEVVDQIAVEQGLDLARLKTDMQDPEIAANIQRTQILAQTLLFTGTPAFLVDDQVTPGYTPIDGLMASIATVRAAGGCKLC